MKQVDVADYLGIQQTVYSRYERGFQTIPVEHLIKLADLYKVSVDYILGREQYFLKESFSFIYGQQIQVMVLYSYIEFLGELYAVQT